MPYVHLANGEVKKLDADAMTKAFGDEPPNVFVDGGKQYQVIGIYAEEVDIEGGDQSQTTETEKQESPLGALRKGHDK